MTRVEKYFDTYTKNVVNEYLDYQIPVLFKRELKKIINGNKFPSISKGFFSGPGPNDLKKAILLDVRDGKSPLSEWACNRAVEAAKEELKYVESLH